MNWIVASLCMLLSSVALYLCVRKSNALKIPRELVNLAMFLIPVPIYAALALHTQTRFAFTPVECVLIAIQAVFFSYLGNVFSLKSIEYAPNPGYSLMISKSYVVFTTIASIFLFATPLTGNAVLAITLIVAFSALIVIDRDKDRPAAHSSWFLYAIGSFFCSGMLALSSKYLLNMGVPILARLLLSMFLTSVLILGETVYKKIKLTGITSDQLVTLLLIGCLGASFSYFMQVGFNLAPNVGFVNATNAASISLLTLMSAIIFKDELTARKMIGIVGVTAGLILLFL